MVGAFDEIFPRPAVVVCELGSYVLATVLRDISGTPPVPPASYPHLEPPYVKAEIRVSCLKGLRDGLILCVV